jgi:ethanolamine utilization protein EutQ
MPRHFFTAEDVRRLAERKDVLILRDDDVLTHEAADVAYALGVKVVRETGSGRGVSQEAPSVLSNLPPLKVVHLSSVQVEPFLEPVKTPGTNVWLKDVVGAEDRSPMGAGYMSLDKGEMSLRLPHDEIDIVLEGELVVTRGSEQVRGKAGDVIYIAKGSNVTIGTPNWTRFVYVVLPVKSMAEGIG